MIFHGTSLEGVFRIEIERHADARGSFGRTFCRDELGRHGLETHFAQCSTSHSHRAGTLRGMHFQRAPDAEVKLVRCVRGRIYDVVIDLRPASATYRAWLGFHLGQPDDFILYVPRGFAHGFQTLTDDTEVTYQISDPYAPRSGDGVRYDDPAFGIGWPLPVAAISQKDDAWPLLDGRDPPFAGWVDEVPPAAPHEPERRARPGVVAPASADTP